MTFTRRFFISGFASLGVAGCARAQTGDSIRLHSRPGKNNETSLDPGSHPLGIRDQRDAILYIPKSLAMDRPAPLLVYVHGANGPWPSETQRMTKAADDRAFALLMPRSEDTTWDAIHGAYGPDVRAIDSALARTFASCRVDRRRIALCGFSDGGTYALGLGLSNGDFFSSVIAFSPGFIPAGSHAIGSPRVFISHGTIDDILPIDKCSRQIVPLLRGGGLKVTYREFDGKHTVPPEILTEAMNLFLKT